MSTNYYAIITKPEPVGGYQRTAEACADVVANEPGAMDRLLEVLNDPGRHERLHIGKSSVGWCFALHVWEDDERPRNLVDWMRLLLTTRAKIVDEYDDPISFEDLMRVITCRERLGRKPLTDADLDRMHGDTARILGYQRPVMGPHGLIRHGLGRDCIGHGEGTWDLITGYFS